MAAKQAPLVDEAVDNNPLPSNDDAPDMNKTA
jgi:hypothetical protein